VNRTGEEQFYVMQRVDSLIPRTRLPAELQLDTADTREVCLSVWDRLVELHAVDPVAAGQTSPRSAVSATG